MPAVRVWRGGRTGERGEEEPGGGGVPGSGGGEGAGGGRACFSRSFFVFSTGQEEGRGGTVGGLGGGGRGGGTGGAEHGFLVHLFLSFVLEVVAGGCFVRTLAGLTTSCSFVRVCVCVFCRAGVALRTHGLRRWRASCAQI